MQTPQADYFTAYRNLKLSRDEKGVLVAEFHSDGGQFIMTAQSHTEFVDAFHRMGQDRANKIVTQPSGLWRQRETPTLPGYGIVERFHKTMLDEFYSHRLPQE